MFSVFATHSPVTKLPLVVVLPDPSNFIKFCDSMDRLFYHCNLSNTWKKLGTYSQDRILHPPKRVQSCGSCQKIKTLDAQELDVTIATVDEPQVRIVILPSLRPARCPTSGHRSTDQKYQYHPDHWLLLDGSFCASHLVQQRNAMAV